MLMATRDRETDEAMSDKELIDEVLTLIVAGHETTAAALTWTWYLDQPAPGDRRRSCRPRPIAPAREATLGLDAAEALAFTHQVLQEALRLYPPGWLITRRTIEADELGGFPIAPRTDVFISPYMLHRHPAFWSEPEEFRPERFAGADAEERHRFAYIPFAVGPAALHRREHRDVRDAGARARHVAALSPDARRATNPSNSRRRSICGLAPIS